MTRVKYNNIQGLLVTDWLTVGPNMIIRAVINPSNYYYEIRQFDSTRVLGGYAKNLRQAKTIIKSELTKSGVNFTGEIRSRS